LNFTDVPDGTYTITYDGGSFTGVSVSGGSATISASAGTYDNLSITANGCTSTDDVDVTLTDPASPTAVINAADVCEGTNVSLDGSASTPGSGTITSYEWDTDNDSSFDDATGVNPSVSLAVGTYTIGLRVTTVSPTSVGGSVTADQTICSGSTPAQLSLSGETGAVVRWESSTDGGSNWTPITNTNTTYDPPALTQTTQYRAVVQSGVCPEAESAAATITVQSPPNAGTNGTLQICEGETVTAAELFSSLGGSPDMGGSWSPTLAGADTYTYTVSGAPDCPDATAQVTVTEQDPAKCRYKWNPTDLRW
jgi:hypothetical protein